VRAAKRERGAATDGGAATGSHGGARDADWFDLRWGSSKVAVRNVCRRFAPLGEAEDAFAQTMVRCWSARDQYRADSPFSNWACRIARNICTDVLKRQRRNASLDAYLESNEEPPSGLDVFAQVATGEFLETAEVQILGLRPLQLDVLLPTIAGDSYGEIAEAEGIKVGTVKSRLNRARRHAQELPAFAGVA
jgi:RNA polymerase sigma factor (sigma-70 family)